MTLFYVSIRASVNFRIPFLDIGFIQENIFEDKLTFHIFRIRLSFIKNIARRHIVVKQFFAHLGIESDGFKI